MAGIIVKPRLYRMRVIQEINDNHLDMVKVSKQEKIRQKRAKILAAVKQRLVNNTNV